MATATAQDGATIYYETAGEGTPVVLVHGITESCRTWDPVRDRLVAAGYRVIALDLRGHGQSPPAAGYDLASLAGDVAAVAMAEGLANPRVVGHSLGGAVVSALAGAFPVESAVNVDQSLKLDDFQDQLKQAEPALRDPDSFPMVIDGLFGQLAGQAIDAEEWDRVQNIRRADQDVVLGVWELVLTAPREELAAAVEGAAGGVSCPYLSLHGIDPGDEYKAWLQGLEPQALVEVWPDLGHYPHLVEPDRFVARLREFWGD
jgi:pimeloyl-ACP methyl ester carboxylesterase